jgi:Fic family protein
MRVSGSARQTQEHPEAVLSSQIEGTEASLVDLLEYEAEMDRAERRVDVREITDYIDALRYGLERIDELV